MMSEWGRRVGFKGSELNDSKMRMPLDRAGSKNGEIKLPLGRSRPIRSGRSQCGVQFSIVARGQAVGASSSRHGNAASSEELNQHQGQRGAGISTHCRTAVRATARAPAFRSPGLRSTTMPRLASRGMSFIVPLPMDYGAVTTTSRRRRESCQTLAQSHCDRVPWCSPALAPGWDLGTPRCRSRGRSCRRFRSTRPD
jgi:hypothetical protein